MSYKLFIKIRKLNNSHYELFYGTYVNGENIIDSEKMEFDSFSELLNHLSFFIDKKELARKLLENKKIWSIEL